MLPYNTFDANFFLVANELLNYIQLILLFFFTDAAPDISSKFFAANAFPYTLGMIGLLNLSHGICLSYVLYKDLDWLKNKQIKYLDERADQYYKDIKEFSDYEKD